MTSYVYLIESDGNGPLKVGHSADPMQRITSLQSQAPGDLRFVRVLAVASRAAAAQFEAYALSWLSGHTSKGEWVTCRASAEQVFNEIAPAVDVTDGFIFDRPDPKRGRAPIHPDELVRKLEKASKRHRQVMDYHINNGVQPWGAVSVSDVEERRLERAGAFEATQ